MNHASIDDQAARSIFVYSEEMSWFDFGPDHPFRPERASKTYELCSRYGLLGHPWMAFLEPEPLDARRLASFHDPEYLRLLRDASEGRFSFEMLERGLGTGDNPVVPGLWEWALRTVGGTCEAMLRIVRGEALIGFNPLGGFHHGMPGHAEGFCYLNDVAVALTDVLSRFPNTKAAFIDLDAHHGNGVQQAFYEDPRVLFVSLHETGRTLYPWCGNETEMGEGEGRGFTVNVPLEPGTDDEVYAFAFDAVVPPLVRSFRPDFIVSVLGADTLVSDPLTHLKLTNNGYQRAVRRILELCPKILALGGGGYDLYRTARCWTLAWGLLNGVAPTDEYAGLVGGMMFGPEMEVGSLYDHPFFSTGPVKAKAFEEAERVIAHLHSEVFPIHGLEASVR